MHVYPCPRDVHPFNDGASFYDDVHPFFTWFPRPGIPVLQKVAGPSVLRADRGTGGAVGN
eukprot:gene20086-biopygen16096